MVSAREIARRLGLGQGEVAVVEVEQDLEDPSGQSFIFDVLFRGLLSRDSGAANQLADADPDRTVVSGDE